MLFKILFKPYFLPLVILVGGFVFFKMATPDCELISDDATIFVLTGDSRRIPFALQKLEGFPKRELYVIGAGTPFLESPFKNQIHVENSSKTTYENAIAIKHIARQKLLRKITLITTADHINRAKFLIKKEMPYIEITSCPVPLSKMPASKRLQRWVEEYIKFIGTVIGITEKA